MTEVGIILTVDRPPEERATFAVAADSAGLDETPTLGGLLSRRRHRVERNRARHAEADRRRHRRNAGGLPQPRGIMILTYELGTGGKG